VPEDLRIRTKATRSAGQVETPPAGFSLAVRTFITPIISTFFPVPCFIELDMGRSGPSKWVLGTFASDQPHSRSGGASGALSASTIA